MPLGVPILSNIPQALHESTKYKILSPPLENCSSRNGMPPVGAGTFCPSPMLVFYISLCRKCLPAWNVKYKGHNVPAPTGSFPFPELQFPRVTFILISFCYSLVDTVQYSICIRNVHVDMLYLERTKMETVLPMRPRTPIPLRRTPGIQNSKTGSQASRCGSWNRFLYTRDRIRETYSLCRICAETTSCQSGPYTPSTD